MPGAALLGGCHRIHGFGNAGWTKTNENTGFSALNWDFTSRAFRIVHPFARIMDLPRGRSCINTLARGATHCDDRVTGERIAAVDGRTWKSPVNRSRCSPSSRPVTGVTLNLKSTPARGRRTPTPRETTHAHAFTAFPVSAQSSRGPDPRRGDHHRGRHRCGRDTRPDRPAHVRGPRVHHRGPLRSCQVAEGNAHGGSAAPETA